MRILRSLMHKAAKTHDCDSCRKPIKKGERYVRTSTEDSERRIVTVRLHAECAHGEPELERQEQTA